MSQSHPERLGKKYVLLDSIGSGGMAEVFRAKLLGEAGFEKPIVLKKLHSHVARDRQMVEHFTNEARLAALLQHDNIGCIYDFGEVDGTFIIAMEYLFGKDLATILHKLSSQQTVLPPQLAVMILARVCNGMEYAHTLCDFKGNALHLIHRDLTPQNIFITYDGKVKILDFGIAKSSIFDNRTRVGVVKGKVNYLSPEQISGEKLDHRSDIFSMGILLYEMLSGTQLYLGETGEVIRKSVQADFIPLEETAPDLDQNLYDITAKCLQKDPDERYQSCKDLLADLTHCFSHIEADNSMGLDTFLQNLYTDVYEQEKHHSQAIFSKPVQENPTVQFNRSIFLDEEEFIKNEKQTVLLETDTMEYAHQNHQIQREEVSQPNASSMHMEPTGARKNITTAIPFPVEKKTEIMKKTENTRHIPINRPTERKRKIKAERPRKKKSFDYSSLLLLFKKVKFPKTNTVHRLIIIGLVLVITTFFFSIKGLFTLEEDLISQVKLPKQIVLPDYSALNETERNLQLVKLLLQANAAVMDKKLFFPEKESAYTFYTRAIYLSPQNEEAKKGLAALVDTLYSEGLEGIKRDDAKRTARAIALGRYIDPDSPKVLDLEELFDNMKR